MWILKDSLVWIIALVCAIISTGFAILKIKGIILLGWAWVLFPVWFPILLVLSIIVLFTITYYSLIILLYLISKLEKLIRRRVK